MTWQQAGNPQSNITFYENSADGRGYPWAEVLTNDLTVRDGKVIHHKVPTFAVFVYRSGVGQVGRFKYEPKANPGFRLPPRTVGRLVNRWLKENDK